MVVRRKRPVHPSSFLEASMPATTMNPAAMPIRLRTTCNSVNVEVDIPRIMAAPHDIRSKKATAAMLRRSHVRQMSERRAFVSVDKLGLPMQHHCPEARDRDADARRRPLVLRSEEGTASPVFRDREACNTRSRALASWLADSGFLRTSLAPASRARSTTTVLR